MTIQHLRSSTASKRPIPAAMSDGQLAVNTNTASPGLFFKDSAGALIKVGPVHVGTTAPNASPAGGGETGNTVGEQWLDTTGGTYVFKVWDGSAWRSESGTFVDVNGDVMTGALGIIAGSAGSPGLYISGDTNTGIYSPGADQLAISTGGSGRLFVDASGRIIVGAATAAIGIPLEIVSNAPGLAVGVRGRSADNIGIIGFYPNNSSTEYARIQSNGDSSLSFGTGPSGSERLRIDSSGRLLVGTSSESGNALLTVRGNTGSATGAGVLDIGLGTTRPGSADTPIGYIRFTSTSNTSSNYHYASIAAESDGTSGSDTDIPGRLVFSTTPDGAAAPVERMRINNSGYTTLVAENGVQVNSTTAAAGKTHRILEGKYSGTSGVQSSGTTCFVVYTDGDVQNTNNSYGAISDVKLKENIVDATSQWSDIKALQVRKYNFKEGQTHTQIGLVAQEVELVSPGLVSESPDRDAEGNDLGTVTKSVNYSVLYMKAVKALQEAMERIETLEAKVAALESA